MEDHTVSKFQHILCKLQYLASILQESKAKHEKTSPLIHRALREILSYMVLARKQFDAYLLAGSNTQIDENLIQDNHTALDIDVLDQTCSRFQKRVEIITKSKQKISFPNFDRKRYCMLELEKEVIGIDDSEELNLGSEYGLNDHNYKGNLWRAILFLRKTEVSCIFQSKLLRDQIRWSRNNSYSRENFSYGTTPLRTWLHLFNAPLLQKHVSFCKESSLLYTVFGSSCGYLVFYGYFILSLESHGYEILPYLHDIAVYTLKNKIFLKKEVENIQFHCTDMLTANITNAGIIFLTSQCWDTELCEKVYSKIQKEAMENSIVIDYNPTLQNFKGFKCVYHFKGEVSWNANQSFYVFQRQNRL